MKPHESPRINKKSIRGDSRDSWPVWNRGIKGIYSQGIFIAFKAAPMIIYNIKEQSLEKQSK